MDSAKSRPEQLSAVRPEPSAAPPAITPAMVLYLKQTKPWVRFISIMLFVGTTLMFLLGLLLILGAGLLSSLSRTVFGGAPLGMLGLVNAAMACLYFFPALFLYRYASSIRKAVKTDAVGGIEESLKNQRSFWRFAGIFLLVILVFQISAVLYFAFYALQSWR